MLEPFIIGVNITQPSLYMSVANGADMTSYTVTFFMRPLLERTPIINGSAAVGFAPDNDGNNVRYDWSAVNGDTSVEGEYRGWAAYENESLGIALAEGPEYAIIVTDKGPGFGTETGVIADAISQYMPVTVDKLRQDPRFGDRFVQTHVDYVKRRVLGVSVTADQEASYDPALVDFLAKVTAGRLIAPAKDYWARQYQMLIAEGPTQNATYPSMLQALDQLELRLKREIPQDWRQLRIIVPGLPQLHIEPMPTTSLVRRCGRRGPVTVDPQDSQRIELGGPFWSWIFP